MLGGVCGGLGEYLDIDPVIIRILFVVAVLFGGGGILAYIILWIVIPQKPFTIPKFNNEASTETNTSGEQNQNENSLRNFIVEKRRMNKNSLAGIILIFLGVLFLLDNFVPRFSFHDFWPLILIGIGFALILNARNNQYEVKQ
jgi:phage shock protein PspC (stress-responsive transcriptional regulator)